MSRRWIFAFVWFILLHAYAVVVRPLCWCGDEAINHMALHAKSIPHHIEHDGAIHFDDSGSSGAHQLDYDSDFESHGLITPRVQLSVVIRREAVPAFRPPHIPFPLDVPPAPPPRQSVQLGETLAVRA